MTVLTFTPRGVSLGTVPSLADAFRVLNELEAEGIVERYAVGGAMAMVFWAEPTVTFDLDIFALLPESETGSRSSPSNRCIRSSGSAGSRWRPST